MKKLSTLALILILGLVATSAWAATESLSEKLVRLVYGEAGPTPEGVSDDPAARAAHYEKLAAAYFAKKYDEVELKDLVGFFSTSAGQRLVRSEEKIDNEVVALAFSQVLTGEVPANPQAPAADDPRRLLAAELMGLPNFDQVIRERARQYDIARTGFEKDVKTPTADSIAYIKNLYVERYARRLSERMLTEIMTFYRTKLGTRFAKSQVELKAVLEKPESAPKTTKKK